ncbi:MAG TPA: 3-isopropylmalate dehydrogenase [Spirochaetota bacterium]|nr:3-isopropylmalate dehydrogenase [Spirochaetota bacterium]
MAYKIALYPGDGIGPEVVAEAEKVIKKVKLDCTTTKFDWNSSLYAKIGHCAPEDFIEQLRGFDAILLGALGNKDKAPEHVAVEPLLMMRKNFDQYVNIRPSVLLPGVGTPLKDKKEFDIDLVCIRENTEGEYTTLGGRHYVGTQQECAMQINYFTRIGVERIIRYAFETAKKRVKKHVTSITKSNVLKYSMVMWDEILEEVASDYPDIKYTKMYVDAAAMNLVRCPETFDVIVASNLFGDILTDISAIVTGGIGFAGSANLNPTREMPSMFEPVHGSAPDIAGQQKANPIAAIMSCAMMIEFLGEKEIAKKIEAAVIEHLKDDKIKTPDRGGNNKTSEVGDDIVARL